MFKAFIKQHKKLVKNPKEFYGQCHYGDQTTVFGFVNALSFICIIISCISWGIPFIATKENVLVGTIIVIGAVLALSCIISYIVASDKLEEGKYETVDIAMAFVSLYSGTIFSGAIVVLLALFVVIELLTFIVYRIPHFIIEIVCNMITNNINKKNDNPKIATGIKNMEKDYNNFLN